MHLSNDHTCSQFLLPFNGGNFDVLHVLPDFFKQWEGEVVSKISGQLSRIQRQSLSMY